MIVEPKPHENIELNVDWGQLGFSPNGVTAMFYPKDGKKPLNYLSHNVHTSLLSVDKGVYDVVVFNNSPEEFASIDFRSMDDYRTAEIFYTQGAADPERVAVATVTDFEVTPEIQELNVKPERLFVDGEIRIDAKGVYNIRNIRAYITGLAGSYMIADGTPKAGQETFRTFTSSWKVNREPGEYSMGTLTSSFMAFGMPGINWRDEIEAEPEDVKIHMSLLLVDNKTVMNFTFPIGDMIRLWKRGSEPVIYITVDAVDGIFPIEIHDVKPVDGTAGGFDAEVDNWGEDEEYEFYM